MKLFIRTRSRGQILGGGLLLFLLCLSLLVIPSRALRVFASGPLSITQQNCANVPTIDMCEGQDPIQQHCVADAQTVTSVNAIWRGQVIGRVDSRFSPHCKSYWVRIIAYANSQGVVTQVTAHNAIDATVDMFSNSTRAADGSLSAYTNMDFTVPPRGPWDGGFFSLYRGLQSLGVLLPA
jgi:Protein of unknown function (DUF2690)